MHHLVDTRVDSDVECGGGTCGSGDDSNNVMGRCGITKPDGAN